MAEAKWVTPDELQKLVSAVLEQDVLEQELPRGDSSTRRFKRQRLPAA